MLLQWRFLRCRQTTLFFGTWPITVCDSSFNNTTPFSFSFAKGSFFCRNSAKRTEIPKFQDGSGIPTIPLQLKKFEICISILYHMYRIYGVFVVPLSSNYHFYHLYSRFTKVLVTEEVHLWHLVISIISLIDSLSPWYRVMVRLSLSVFILVLNLCCLLNF